MTWICQQCNNSHLDDESVVCDICGSYRRSQLHLRSSEADWHTRTDCIVSRAVYRKLYPGVEHQYIPHNEENYPFSLCRDNNVWTLLVNIASTLAVKLNSEVCEIETAYPLRNGDVITLASKANPAKEVAPLTIFLAPF